MRIFPRDLATTYIHPQGILNIQKTYLFKNVSYVTLNDTKHINITLIQYGYMMSKKL